MTGPLMLEIKATEGLLGSQVWWLLGVNRVGLLKGGTPFELDPKTAKERESKGPTVPPCLSGPLATR